VLWTIDQNFGGLENMSLIPGNELPTQNIGAYGTEIKDTFISCEALTTINHELKHSKEDCHFGYRKVS
jgi:UDP-N-acetylmuramate dehydrogenase